jgi:ATP-dependent Lon protease
MSDIIPLNQIDHGESQAVPSTAPVIPLRNVVVFPGTITPLRFNKPENVAAIEAAVAADQHVVLVWQEDPELETVTPKALPKIGTLARLVRVSRQGDDLTVVAQARERVRLDSYSQETPFLQATFKVMLNHLPKDDGAYWEAAMRNLRDSAYRLIELDDDIPNEAEQVLRQIEDPVLLTDVLAANLKLDMDQRQRLLEHSNVQHRFEVVQKFLSEQLNIAELQQKLRDDLHTEMSESQKKAYLREQVRTIQKELGEDDGAEEQIADLAQRLEEAHLPEKAKEQADRELKRLGMIPQASPEHSVIATYLETLAELPWDKLSEETVDLDKARKILERDHHGLDKVKKRILEYLAVRKLKPDGQGAILCLSGPPGVGKTSLGKSIAEALGREFIRISVGGLRDESEIRGHRRTYIGSMPGRLIQELRRAGTRNPVILLDEVDKIGADFRGDPASALLEVLDPNQNSTFVDRYLDVPFDLSQVLFIATANYLDPIPAPLLDRMEVTDLPGYTEAEKHSIAKKYLTVKQREAHGLKKSQIKWTDDAMETLVEHYTREAGVRNLEREIGAVTRGIAAAIVEGDVKTVKVTPKVVEEKLGPKRYVRDASLDESAPGVVNGLAYTPVGGEILHIEALAYPGSGRVKLTGQLGDVMKESVDAAYSLVRSRAKALGIKKKTFREKDVHVHVPAGAIPKDGPSAGIAMFTSLASLLTNRNVRHNVAMTGEVTLRGLVLPIGGLKEKSIAALRAGVTKVLIPAGNAKDIPDLPDEVRDRLEIVPVKTVDEVLKHALE